MVAQKAAWAWAIFGLGTTGALAAQPVGALTAALGQAAYDRHDAADAQRIWQAAAATGDAHAAFDLGLLYDAGADVPPSAKRALDYYRMAAAGGMPEAEFNVAIMYDAGRGAARDASQAALWYARAAVNGHARARYNLAQLYDAGDGVPRNPDQARQWYAAAAARGLAAAAAHSTTARSSAPAATDANAQPAPAVPMPALVVANPHAAPKAELVWSSPAQAGKVRFYVTVEPIAASGAKLGVDTSTTLSAAVVNLPAGAGDYRWRVYTVVAGTPHYAASGWDQFRTGSGSDRTAMAGAGM